MIRTRCESIRSGAVDCFGQGKSRGVGRLRATELPGSGPSMRELGRIEHRLAGTMPEETPAAVARQPGDDRRAVRERSRGIVAAAGDAGRSLRPTNRASEFGV